MQLMNVSTRPGDGTEGKFEGYTVKDGEVQGSWYQLKSTIKEVQSRYDEMEASKFLDKKVPLWKKPLVLFGNATSNFFGFFRSSFKAIFYCFSEN
jgi:hypothetical protein